MNPPLDYPKERDKKLFELYDPVGDIKNSLDFYIKIVVTVLIIGFITLLVMVSTLIIDSFHINSAIYKEYSQKTEAIETLQHVIQQEVEANKANQQIIIDLEKQILQLFRQK